MNTDGFSNKLKIIKFQKQKQKQKIKIAVTYPIVNPKSQSGSK